MTLIWIFWLIFILCPTSSATENKTSSECWACKPNTPHVLNCTGGGVILIQGAYYGYKTSCSSGITEAGCTVEATNRCCKPGGAGVDCVKHFNITDGEKLNTTCSGKSTCIFNSIRHDQNSSCNGVKFTKNSLTRIKYTCQTQDTPSTSVIRTTSSWQATSSSSPVETFTQTSSPGVMLSSSSITPSARSIKTTSPLPTSHEDSDTSTIIVVIICALLVVLAVIVVILCVLRRKRQQRKTARNRPLVNTKVIYSVQEQNPVYHVVENDATIPRNQEAVAKWTQSQISLKKRHVDTADNYSHIDDKHIIKKKHARSHRHFNDSDKATKMQECDYNHIGSKGHKTKVTTDDTYNHIGGDNSETKIITDGTYNHIAGDMYKITTDETYNHIESDKHEDDYHHIGGDNSNTHIPLNDTYNHTNSRKNMDDDDYHHIDINNDQSITTDPEYNHIGGADDVSGGGYNQ